MLLRTDTAQKWLTLKIHILLRKEKAPSRPQAGPFPPACPTCRGRARALSRRALLAFGRAWVYRFCERVSSAVSVRSHFLTTTLWHLKASRSRTQVPWFIPHAYMERQSGICPKAIGSAKFQKENAFSGKEDSKLMLRFSEADSSCNRKPDSLFFSLDFLIGCYSVRTTQCKSYQG